MTIDIIVLRDGGAFQGEDIVDPLLSTLTAALERGRYELNMQAGSLQPVTWTLPYNYAYRTGKLIQAVDHETGEVIYAKITGVSHSFRGAERISTLNVQRVSSFKTEPK
jgi:hypothetical protein